MRLSQRLVLLLVLALTSGCPEGDHGGATGPFVPDKISLTEIDLRGATFMVLKDEPLTFRDAKGNQWVAPAGTLTDGASVPRLALWVTDGRFAREFLKAAVVHDAYCQEENETRCPDQYRKKPWRDVHRMFHEACLAGGTSATTAKLMFLAVWLGGPRWDDPDSDLEAVPDELLQTAYATCEQIIKEEDPSIDEIETWINKREPTIVAVSKLQSAGISALHAEKMPAADQARQQSEEVLTHALEELPNDQLLLNVKGHHHKSWAAEYDKKGLGEQVEQELNKAETAYETVIEVKPQDPSALSGMGSVLNLRKDFTSAEPFVRKALEVEPNFKPARREMEVIEKSRESQPP